MKKKWQISKKKRMMEARIQKLFSAIRTHLFRSPSFV